MTFTYSGDLTNARDFVRFHIGDTSADAAWLPDEVISSLILVEGTKEAAVIASLDYIITQLSKPDFKADWLSVSYADARKGYESLRSLKRVAFGLVVGRVLRVGAVNTYRADRIGGRCADTGYAWNHPEDC